MTQTTELSHETKERVLAAVKLASTRWQTAFNSGSAEGAAAQYEVDALMVAKPFGEYRGRDQIQAFWQDLIEKGLSDVTYIEPKITVVSENAALLASGWKMNAAHGVITKELWVLQPDGKALLREDHFEALG